MRLLVFLVAPALLLALACSSGDGAELRDAPIESAEIVTIDRVPPGYELHVVAQIPGSSCHRPQAPAVRRDGTTFRVTVQNLFTGAEVCTADLGYRDLTIPLPGDFDSGARYTVLLNDEPPLNFSAR